MISDSNVLSESGPGCHDYDHPNRTGAQKSVSVSLLALDLPRRGGQHYWKPSITGRCFPAAHSPLGVAHQPPQTCICASRQENKVFVAVRVGFLSCPFISTIRVSSLPTLSGTSRGRHPGTSTTRGTLDHEEKGCHGFGGFPTEPVIDVVFEKHANIMVALKQVDVGYLMFHISCNQHHHRRHGNMSTRSRACHSTFGGVDKLQGP